MTDSATLFQIDDEPSVGRLGTRAILQNVIDQGQDFEWYPTTARMIGIVKSRIPADARSIMDIGAGDGRVLLALGEKCPHATLYGIEKSTVLVQAQPDNVVPVGTEFHEQNLACLQVDYIFCNPPYSQFEAWAGKIIESGFAKRAYLVLPQRWAESRAIKIAIARRGAQVKTIHTDDFHDADRQARAVVHIVEVRYPCDDSRSWCEEPKDPFDIWFDQNINTFDQGEDPEDDEQQARDLARVRGCSTIGDMVAAYVEEYSRMEKNYRAIFELDHALLKELGVSKEAVREGIKKKMAGLKAKYWKMLFERLDAITSRLATGTKKRFVEKLVGRASIAFTAGNAYAVVLWAIKNANKYYGQQLVELFRELSSAENVKNYKSNQKTWAQGRWRYHNEEHSHYALDYRIVVQRHYAIRRDDCWTSTTNNLADTCHDLIADVVAVLATLGFSLASHSSQSKGRSWEAGCWENFSTPKGIGDVLFQVKAHLNGNLHMRFRPDAIKALNIEAGRLLGWLRGPDDVVKELGYTPEDAARYYGSTLIIAPSNIKLLTVQ